MGEYTLPDDYKAAIQVIVNPDEKNLKSSITVSV